MFVLLTVRAIEDFPLFDAKSEPGMTWLLYLETVSRALQLFQIHFNRSVVPLIVKAPNLHRNLVQEKNDWIGYMESRMDQLLKKQLEGTFVAAAIMSY